MKKPILLSVLLVLAGCASTQFESTQPAGAEPVCQKGLSAAVLWEPRWRPDQKDVPGREAAAQRGIEKFFATSGCFASARVERASGERPAPPEQRAVFITVHELGPILRIGSPSVVEGGTEVVVDVRSVAAASGRTVADFQAHWRNGGAWVVKGVATLEEDMVSALHAALRP